MKMKLIQQSEGIDTNNKTEMVMNFFLLQNLFTKDPLTSKPQLCRILSLINVIYCLCAFVRWE